MGDKKMDKSTLQKEVIYPRIQVPNSLIIRRNAKFNRHALVENVKYLVCRGKCNHDSPVKQRSNIFHLFFFKCI